MIIEFENEPENLDDFARLLDQELQTLNSDYEAKRYKDMALKQLQIVKAPAGTFYQWLKLKGKVGGQNKIPRLANNREYLDPLLELIMSNH